MLKNKFKPGDKVRSLTTDFVGIIIESFNDETEDGDIIDYRINFNGRTDWEYEGDLVLFRAKKKKFNHPLTSIFK